jgi:hypothetical protein
MSSILRIKNADWRRHEDSQEKSCGQPISLVAFLQTENIKLQNSASQLEVEITALREAERILHSQQNGAAQDAAP